MEKANKPLISVVTPSYNQEEFIEDTIVSVKNQDYPSIEHIVIDGGSTDNTIKILERYENKYNLKWISESDSGQSNAINKGLEIAKGNIVGWLNSDDVYFDKNVLSRVANYFNECDSHIIYGDIVWINQESKVYNVRSRPSCAKKIMRFTNPIAQPATFLQRNIIKKHKIDESLEYSLDYEYWIRLSKSGIKFYHVSDVLAGFRKHGKQKTSEVDKKMLREKKNILFSNYNMTLETHLFFTLFIESLCDIVSIKRAYELQKRNYELAFDGRICSSISLFRNILYNILNRYNPKYIIYILKKLT